MGIHEKIRFMRLFKGWSQEEMAEKLEMAVSGYAKIEQGKTDINFSKLQKIAETFGIELTDLVGLNEKNVFNVISNCNNHTASINVFIPESSLQQEIKELRQLTEQQAQEIASLKKIISKKEES